MAFSIFLLFCLSCLISCLLPLSGSGAREVQLKKFLREFRLAHTRAHLVAHREALGTYEYSHVHEQMNDILKDLGIQHSTHYPAWPPMSLYSALVQDKEFKATVEASVGDAW